MSGFKKQKGKQERYYISLWQEWWPGEANSVIIRYLNEEHQAETLTRVCASFSTWESSLIMHSCPFLVNRVQSCIRLSFLGCWLLVCSKQNRWRWSSWFLPILSSPNLLEVPYLCHVSNLIAHEAHQVPWGPQAGQGVNGHTRELHGDTAATLPQSTGAMWHHWPTGARFWFSQRSWKSRILCESS